MAKESKKEIAAKLAHVKGLVERAFRLGVLNTRYKKAYEDTRKNALANLQDLGMQPANGGDCVSFDGGDLKRVNATLVTVDTNTIIAKTVKQVITAVDHERSTAPDFVTGKFAQLLACVKTFDVDKLKEAFGTDVVTESQIPGDIRFTSNSDVKKLVTEKADALDQVLFDLIGAKAEKAA